MVMMHRRHLLFSTVWLIVRVFCCADILARSKSDAHVAFDRQQASKHFRKGEALFANGDHPEAVEYCETS